MTVILECIDHIILLIVLLEYLYLLWTHSTVDIVYTIIHRVRLPVTLAENYWFEHLATKDDYQAVQCS